jgi:hypothetical protein
MQLLELELELELEQDTSLRLELMAEPLMAEPLPEAEAAAPVIPPASTARQLPAQTSPRHPDRNALRDTVALLTCVNRGVLTPETDIRRLWFTRGRV